MKIPKTIFSGTTRFLESPWTHTLTGASVLLLDLLTSRFLLFPILFVIPVAQAAWYCRPFWAYFLAITLPVGRIFVAMAIDVPVPMGYLIANAVTRMAVLMLLAFFIARTSQHTKALEKQIAGLVTVCAWSRTVEYEGEWISFEGYLSRRFGLQTSHGISPEEFEKAIQENIVARTKNSEREAAQPVEALGR